jgi:cation diffusion facilitator CzcD-associated flavoprotein CzcO
MAGLSHARSESDISVVIIGAGASGLCMAVELKRAGYDRITIIEKSNRVGGTWNDNRYPGAGCDVMSHLYCYSFEPNSEWSRRFPLQPEIQRYFEMCADKYDLYRHIRFGTEIASASFDDKRGEWTVRTTTGEQIIARVLVSGTGQLNRPHVPELSHLATFRGKAFHSARWGSDEDVVSKRLALIGSGASAIQIVPEIAKRATHLSVFQRTPSYVIKRNDRPYYDVEKWAFRHVPLVRKAYRAGIYSSLELRFFGLLQGSLLSKAARWMALRNLASEVSDIELRNKLTPDYPPGCKRILISDDFYRAMSEPHVDLVTSAIDRATPDGLVTRDGQRHVVDTIVFATGFETTTFLAPMSITGRAGLSLEEAWQNGAEAHKGVVVSGFPNLFLLYGPNTNLGHNSILFMVECQVRYAMGCIRELDKRRARFIEARRDAMDRFNVKLQADLSKTAWAAGCQSWYKTDSGKITNNWSGLTLDYWWRTRKPDLSELDIT